MNGIISTTDQGMDQDVRVMDITIMCNKKQKILIVFIVYSLQ